MKCPTCSQAIDPRQLTIHQLWLLDLGLSVRAYNCLRQNDVETVDELTKHTQWNLLSFRQLGKRTLTNIEKVLANLELKLDPRQENTLR